VADEQEPLWRFGDQVSRGGFRMDEITSALQKSIRRGDERRALWWATELDLSGYGSHAWKRLTVITSEDVGLAWLEGPAVIHALHEAWVAEKKAAGKDARPGVGMLYLVHSVIALCRAPKSRVVDNACNLYYAHRDSLGVRRARLRPGCAHGSRAGAREDRPQHVRRLVWPRPADAVRPVRRPLTSVDGRRAGHKARRAA
jgi:hypothetical protein